MDERRTGRLALGALAPLQPYARLERAQALAEAVVAGMAAIFESLIDEDAA